MDGQWVGEKKGKRKESKRRSQLGCNGPKFATGTSKIYRPRLPRKTRPRFNNLAGPAGSSRGLPLNRVKQTIPTDKRRGFFDDQWAIAKCGSCSLMADHEEKNGDTSRSFFLRPPLCPDLSWEK